MIQSRRGGAFAGGRVTGRDRRVGPVGDLLQPAQALAAQTHPHPALPGAARRRADADHCGHPPPGGTHHALVDGIILVADDAPPELVRKQAGAGAPLVLLGESSDHRWDHITVDHAGATQDATEHLLRAGCRQIAAIGVGPDESSTRAQRRMVGYRRALRRAGLAESSGHLQPALLHRRDHGYRAARTLLAQDWRPDGLLCFSDLLAIGAMRAVFDAGLRVPEDVAVVGIGDSEEARYARPALSTVSVDTAFIAREAVARVTSRIALPDAAPTRIIAPHTVLVRESSAVLGGPSRSAPRDGEPAGTR
ncbi:LacI family DNA-binding transcriptional regulator [Micromonospora sp. DT62]|uniref:LacI family DNA-binding transcriptional regulator n=1 Tax=Micromonospora sp. DT62 TaxID=3416521 RepID=UPI003CE8CD78